MKNHQAKEFESKMNGLGLTYDYQECLFHRDRSPLGASEGHTAVAEAMGCTTDAVEEWAQSAYVEDGRPSVDSGIDTPTNAGILIPGGFDY